MRTPMRADLVLVGRADAAAGGADLARAALALARQVDGLVVGQDHVRFLADRAASRSPREKPALPQRVDLLRAAPRVDDHAAADHAGRRPGAARPTAPGAAPSARRRRPACARRCCRPGSARRCRPRPTAGRRSCPCPRRPTGSRRRRRCWPARSRAQRSEPDHLRGGDVLAGSRSSASCAAFERRVDVDRTRSPRRRPSCGRARGRRC